MNIYKVANLYIKKLASDFEEFCDFVDPEKIMTLEELQDLYNESLEDEKADIERFYRKVREAKDDFPKD